MEIHYKSPFAVDTSDSMDGDDEEVIDFLRSDYVDDGADPDSPRVTSPLLKNQNKRRPEELSLRPLQLEEAEPLYEGGSSSPASPCTESVWLSPEEEQLQDGNRHFVTNGKRLKASLLSAN